MTISLNSPETMALDACKAIKSGFSIIKLKVGGDVATDFERIKAILDAVGKEV